MGCSWGALGRFWLPLGGSWRLFVSLWPSGSLWERFWIDFGAIFAQNSLIFEAFFRASRGLFLDLFFSQFFVRRCSESCSLCTWRKKRTQANSSRKPMVLHDFSKFAWPPGSPRGRQERIKQSTTTAHKKHETTIKNNHNF